MSRTRYFPSEYQRRLSRGNELILVVGNFTTVLVCGDTYQTVHGRSLPINGLSCLRGGRKPLLDGNYLKNLLISSK